MFILFDANVWISQVGLRSKNGAAVRHFARRHDATIAIPEIVQLEVEEILTKRMLELKKQIEDGHRQLLQLFGKIQPIHVPVEEEIRQSVKNIIPDFDVPILKIPLNLKAARSSMKKLLRGIPPSKNKEQFRDGLIWAHCLDLLSEDDVYLVSEDKDFWEKGDYTRGLASELVAEMKLRTRTRQVVIKRNVTELLDEIRVPVELDNTHIFEAVAQVHGETIEELLESHGFALCDLIDGDVSYFATEHAHIVYFTFDYCQRCRDSTAAGRQDGDLQVKGVGFIDLQTKTTTDMQLSNILLDYPDWKAGGRARGTVFLSAHFNAPVVHRIRVPLECP